MLAKSFNLMILGSFFLKFFMVLLESSIILNIFLFNLLPKRSHYPNKSLAIAPINNSLNVLNNFVTWEACPKIDVMKFFVQQFNRCKNKCRIIGIILNKMNTIIIRIINEKKCKENRATRSICWTDLIMLNIIQNEFYSIPNHYSKTSLALCYRSRALLIDKKPQIYLFPDQNEIDFQGYWKVVQIYSAWGGKLAIAKYKKLYYQNSQQ